MTAREGPPDPPEPPDPPDRRGTRGVSTVVVFPGGDPSPTAHAAAIPADAIVIAADSGIEHAHALGFAVDVAVGDFDSVRPEALAAAEAAGAVVERHPVDKDRTDLEIALDRALGLSPRRIVVLGGHGGRLDHFLGNVAVLASPAYAGVEMSALLGPGRLWVVRDRLVLRGAPGELVSLLALTGPVHGVLTQGLRYPLDGETLLPGSSRGVSNELAADEASVAVASGVLVVVMPGDASPTPPRTGP